MSKQASYTITLPSGTTFVFVRDVPVYIVGEVEPRSSLEFSETKQAAILMEHREAIKKASSNGDLIVRNRLSKIQQPFAIGDQLERSILLVDELRDYLARFGIAVEVAEPAINSGRYTLEDAAKTLGKATGESEKIFLEKLKKVVADKSLPVYWTGSKIGHESLNVRDWVDEAYWNNLNTWLETSFPRLDWRFPEPPNKSNKVYTEKSPGEPFSNPPKTQDEWFNVIEAVMYNHKNQHGNFPTWQQVWSELWDNPPKGYGVTLGKDRYGKNALLMGDQTLNRDSLYKRFRRWTGADK